MKKLTEFLRKYYGLAKYGAFPVILCLFPLLKANKGIDLADTLYSLVNYEAFGSERSVWIMLTFVSNAVGHFLSILPGGGTMLGMKLYTSLILSALALLSYRFFMTKMPAWLSFLSVLSAAGLCWAPSVILYHYLTYVFLFLGAVLLFRGLAGDRRVCLFLAGCLLGVNLFVRFPNNGLEVLLIAALWYYGALRKKQFADVAKETLLCVLGYLVGFLLCLGAASAYLGGNALSFMIGGTLGISGSASDYTFGEMLRSILDAYLHGARWAIYMAICALIGIPFFVLFEGKYLRLRKLVYCLCIPVLFAVLYKWGMFNFKYYQKESALQWGAIFLLVSIGAELWMLASRQVNYDWKLLAMLSLIIVLITPLGSNNYIWPVLNNLFFVAPVTFWTIYKFARWGRNYLDITRKVPLFSVKAMLSAVVLAFFVQAVGVGCFYVFNDGEDGARLASVISVNGAAVRRVRGMYTNEAHAANLSQAVAYLAESFDDPEDPMFAPDLDSGETITGRKYIFYGNIPGLAYILNSELALSTSWPSLDSYPIGTMEEELKEINRQSVSDSNYPPRNAPVIVISKTAVDARDGSDAKLEMLYEDFIDSGMYKMGFFNDEFVVYNVSG